MIKKKYDLNQLNSYTKTGKFTVEKHDKENIYIYGYAQVDLNSNSRFKWDAVNINLRGLIVDADGYVLSRSFQKFFTFKYYLSEKKAFLTDNQIREIPKGKMRIFEKVDGTYTVLYWINDTPYLATQRSFNSPKAKKATEILHNKYSHTFKNLDREKTYIFEAIYPETKVLVDYGNEDKLYLLGIVDTETGKEYELEDIGFPVAKEFTDDLENITNLKELQNLNLPNQEGFVVRYSNGLRVKIKFPWYEKTHKIFNQIIAYKNASFELENQLMQILEVPKRKLNKKWLFEQFKNGVSISEIEKDLPDVYYSLGAENWLINQYEYYKDNSEKIINDADDEVFDLDSRINLPESESVVWNRIERLKNRFN